MTASWAVRLLLEDAAAAKAVRHVPGVVVCQAEGAVWLRGERLDEALELALRAIPGAERFRVLADGQLLPAGRRVPCGWLPDGDWVPLEGWLGLETVGGKLPGRLQSRTPLQLVRTGSEQDASVLMTPFELWRAYGVEAPQVRLDRWRFAVCEDGRAAIWGRPLPPLPGEQFVERGGVCVPAGWTWSPPVEPSLVAELFGLDAGDLAVWHADGRWEHLAAEDFVRATRSAIRETAEVRGQGSGE